MDTRYLRTLVAAVEQGSFSKAAEQLHLTQSAVSQRIKFLEERLGQRLLHRAGSKLSLTEAGSLVLESARQVLAIQERLQKELMRLEESRRISLCCTPTFGTVFLPKVLNDYMMGTSGAVDLKFVFNSPNEAIAGVRNQDFDLAVVEHCCGTDLAGLETFPLPADELVFVSAPALQLPSPELDLEILLQMRLLARKDGCSSKELVRVGLANANRRLKDFNGVVISDDLHLTCQTVLAGGGVSFISRDMVSRYLESGEMIAHRVAGFTHQRSRTVVLNQERAEDRLLRGFINCIFRMMGCREPFAAAV